MTPEIRNQILAIWLLWVAFAIYSVVTLEPADAFLAAIIGFVAVAAVSLGETLNA